MAIFLKRLSFLGPLKLDKYCADTYNRPSPHVNLACMACHRVIDLPSHSVQVLDEEVSASSGYQILGARVLYYAYCPPCRGTKQKEDPPKTIKAI